MAKDMAIVNENQLNVLTFGTKIVGKINAESDFRLDGEIEGDIVCKGKVVIGQRGLLKGSITCVNAEIIGKVLGNFNISETLTLRATAEINGDVKTKSLVVEPNAVFNGSCSMRETPSQSASQVNK